MEMEWTAWEGGERNRVSKLAKYSTHYMSIIRGCSAIDQELCTLVNDVM